jgi:hypothetical protein
VLFLKNIGTKNKEKNMKKLMILICGFLLLIISLSGCLTYEGGNGQSDPSPEGWWTDNNVENWIRFTDVEYDSANINLMTEFFNGENLMTEFFNGDIPPNSNEGTYTEYFCVFGRSIGGPYSELGYILIDEGEDEHGGIDFEWRLEVESYTPSVLLVLSDDDITISFRPMPTP